MRLPDLSARIRALAARLTDADHPAPDAVADVPVTLDRLTLRLYRVLAGGVVAFLLWAALFTLDVVSVAVGEVVPASQIKSIQHLEGGIVEDILVKEGEQVAADEPLVMLKATASDADVGELAVRIATLEVDIARLEAEEKGAAQPAFTPAQMRNNPALVDQARRLFDSRRARQKTLVDARQEAITQRQQMVREISTRIGNSQHNLQLLREQVKISEDLLAQDLTNRLTHLNLVREAGGLQSRIDEDRAALRRAESEIETARAELENARHAYLEEVRTALAEARRSQGEFHERSRKFSDTLDRTTLRAPGAGIVKTIHVKTIGEVVKPGATVVEMVPMGDKLIVEAKLNVQDVGWVQIGGAAAIRLASTDAGLFSPIEARVIHISPDTLTTEDGMAYYRIRLETKADHFRNGEVRYRLLPGVQVSASIILGRRTVLQYLLSPYFANLDQALRER